MATPPCALLEQRPSSPAAPWVLVAAVLASSMAFIDGTALHVALPALQADLGASGATLLWVVNAYALFLAALLLLGGALGDRYGRKRVFMLGIGLFAGASLACGLAPNTAGLIVARALQGVAGALMVPGSLALISNAFAVEQRGKAIGTWTACSVVTTVLGPIVGGLLARKGLWRGVFLINLPLAAVALTILVRRVPESRDECAPARVDFWGAGAATLALAGINYGLIEAAGRGLTAWPVVLALVLGPAAGVLFLLIEARSDHPLLPLSLFRSRTFTGANLLTLCFYTALNALLFFLPLNLIQVQGYDPALAGMAQLPPMVMLVLFSRWAGRLADRHGPRLPLTVGPLLSGLGFLALALPGVTRGPIDFWTHYLPALSLLGLGMALTSPSLSATLMASVSSRRSGLASGINSTVSRLAGVLALTILGTVALVAFRSFLEVHCRAVQLTPETRTALTTEAASLGNAHVPPGVNATTKAAVREAIQHAFVDTFRLIVGIAAALTWLGALLGGLMMERPRPVPEDA